MDDLMAKLQEILSSSEGQENLRQLAGMLGQNNSQNGQLDLSAISSLLGQSGGNGEGRRGDPPEKADGQRSSGTESGGLNLDGLDLGGIDIASLIRVQNILKNIKHDDKNTALIRALRPHLKEERQHRVDEALKLMQLISVLPALRESGLLSKFFGGD